MEYTPARQGSKESTFKKNIQGIFFLQRTLMFFVLSKLNKGSDHNKGQALDLLVPPG
jgi:hypothetical protein